MQNNLRGFRPLTGGGLLLLFCALAPLPASGFILKPLVTFYGTNGAQPYAGLTLDTNRGIFYGTTTAGGAYNQGTVFAVNSLGQFTTLASFDGTNGAKPMGALLLDTTNGYLYGTTSAGGSNDLGTVFRAAITPGSPETLGSFDGTNGSQPQCALVQSPFDGNLYGTTLGGGEFGFGAVFSATPPPPSGPGVASPSRLGPGVTLVASFDSTNTGAYPAAGLTLDNYGDLFGVTSAGGSVYNAGTFFEVLPGSTTPLLPMFAFSGTNGAAAYAPLFMSTNMTALEFNFVYGTNYFFYGTTAGGGTNDVNLGGDGTIYGLPDEGANTNQLTWSFALTNGSIPYAELFEGSDANFYGTTYAGGLGHGTIFSFNPSNSTPIKLLYAFEGGSGGANPYGGVVQGSDGNLYGTTVAGGKGRKGMVFELTGFPPYVVYQPTNQTVQTSNSITLAVMLGGSGPLTYHWLRNSNYVGNARGFSGATTASLTLTNAQPDQSGTYSLVVRNPYGTVSTTNFLLTVVTPYGQGRPGLRINAPAQNAYLPTMDITVMGSTSGTVNVARVFYRLNGSGWQLAAQDNGWAHWTAGLTLSPGTNLFQAYAVNLTGISSLTNSAYFIPSPFAAVAGAYNGLFYDTNNVTPTNAGFFTLNATYLGKFSGSLQLAGARNSFSGQFDSRGLGQTTISRGTLAPLNLRLQLDMTYGTGHITGSVSNSAWAAELSGDLAAFNGSTSIAPQQGRYTFAIPGAGAAPQPAGDGWGAVMVDAAGNAHLSGSLADGTSVAQVVPVSRSGEWPLYASLSSGQGLLLGWLAFSSGANPPLGGDVWWLKSALATSKYYANGLTLHPPIQSSPYAAPGLGTNVFNATNLLVTLSGGGLAPSLTNHITLGSNNRIVNLSSNKLSLSFSLPAGSFSGSMVNPATSKLIPFGGVVLENQGTASGFFLGSGQSGRVSIAPEAR